MTNNNREGWDDISSEGDGIAAPVKSKVKTTAWAVEVEGKITADNVFSSRSFAREVRNVLANPGDDWWSGLSSEPVKAHVRKVELRVVAGR